MSDKVENKQVEQPKNNENTLSNMALDLLKGAVGGAAGAGVAAGLEAQKAVGRAVGGAAGAGVAAGLEAQKAAERAVIAGAAGAIVGGAVAGGIIGRAIGDNLNKAPKGKEQSGDALPGQKDNSMKPPGDHDKNSLPKEKPAQPGGAAGGAIEQLLKQPGIGGLGKEIIKENKNELEKLGDKLQKELDRQLKELKETPKDLKNHIEKRPITSMVEGALGGPGAVILDAKLRKWFGDK